MLAGLALVFFGGPAFAHDEVIGSSPAAGSQVEALPAEIELTFSGVLLDEPGATQVVVTDASGASLVAGDPVLDGTRLTQPLEGTAAGEVTVIWRVVSSDGHPISDEFTFTVGTGGETEGTTAPVAPVETATPLPGPPMQATDFTWIWIVLGVVLVGAGGALVAVLVAKARGPRED